MNLILFQNAKGIKSIIFLLTYFSPEASFFVYPTKRLKKII